MDDENLNNEEVTPTEPTNEEPVVENNSEDPVVENATEGGETNNEENTEPNNEEPVENNEPESGETDNDGDNESTETTESGDDESGETTDGGNDEPAETSESGNDEPVESTENNEEPTGTTEGETSGEENGSDDPENNEGSGEEGSETPTENNENGDEPTGEDEPIEPTPAPEPEEVRVSYTSIAWVNNDQQILHVVDLAIGEDNYGSQLIPIQSSIGQTIVRYLTDNDIVIPVESTNLEDETELTDARLFVIVQENIQAYIDNFAHTRDYDNAIYCISYKDSIVPRFRNEAKRMMVYRDLCWAIATDFNLKYINGERERPTLEEIMNALPELSWEGPIIGLDGEEIDLDAL